MADRASESVRLQRRAVAAQIGLRGDPDDTAFVESVRDALKVEIPTVANTVVDVGDIRVLWLGPDEWLVVADRDSAPLVQALEAALAGRHVAVNDLSAARIVLELSGPDARAVLEKGCRLDLHPRAFASGQCAGTIIAQTQVYLEQVDDRPTYRLYVRPSFAGHFEAWLRDAMAEFGTAHAP